jgi:tRNA(fMet)-specific endonuclease VapC
VKIRHGLNRLPVGNKRTKLEHNANLAFAALTIQPMTLKIAEQYGQLKASLEAQGLNVGDNDLWIAATALVSGEILVTRDQIFKRIPGLVVEDWSL